MKNQKGQYLWGYISMNNFKINVKFKNEKESYVIVSGIIDTLSADKFSNTIVEIHREYNDSKIFLDFTKVSMITNACVEHLMMFKENGVKLQLVGVKKEVNTILKLTGADKVLDIETEVESLDVSNCKLLGKGFHSEVYRLDDETIAKIYYDLPSIDTLINERIIAKQAFIKGVPTEISFGLCESNGRAGLMYELVDANTLLSMLEKDIDNMDKYIKDYVCLVKKVHEFDDEGMVQVPDMKQILINNINNLRKFISSEGINKLMNVINSVPDSNHLLHGDPHPANVMLSDKGMIFIDLSDMRTGDEILDLVYLNRTLIQYNKLPSNTYSLGVENSKKLWELFFDEYYKELNEQDKKDIYNKIDLLALVNITEKFMMKNPDNEEAQLLFRELQDKINQLNI